MLASRGGPQQKAEAAVDAARGSGDVRGLIAALGDLKTWTDAVQSLKDTIDQRAEEERQRREQELAAMQAHTDALSQNSAELKRRTDLAQATINTSEYQKANGSRT